ncbi:hypothetical protein BO94DRAFT_585704 [Aspergillus sclerotioniger CBS 115572]|uniref:Uncharacterized protein n=1 Tax=Aspergillus sclerotioniger CBS 115572 TaxID=1450535 RepID=A0A317WQD9_9EURO|nr:hypothetical protein BO94DRAFT_585704 [Aspergillus sclerotioniger CBS 115572]PWY87138.1 hypothetical protein BO94DRAFT_585704 [Aspergillus sclerotioniger CBS 115572]
MADPVTSGTDSRPTGNRRSARPDEDNAGLASGLVPNAGMKFPGATQGQDEKESLKIRIHLNLQAKVKLDLDAQLYGDIVIGLL